MTPIDADLPEVSVRQGGTDDAEVLADLYSEARRAAIPQMPPAVHTDEEHRDYYRRHLTAEPDHTIWVAESDGEVLGFALCTPTFLDGIYVRPDLKGQGLGSLLLDVVEATHPDGYELWVFESNVAAWSRSSAPTGPATRRRRRTSRWPGVPDRALQLPGQVDGPEHGVGLRPVQIGLDLVV